MHDAPGLVREGSAEIIAYPGKETKKDKVFYNPHMKFNRDISVMALRAFQASAARTLKIIDPLSATGIRGIRYALECEGIDKLILNDLNPEAVRLAKINIERNKIKNAEVYSIDACELLSRYKYILDFVDLDPFGSPMPFLDSAARAVSNKGFLAATATDTAPLAGTYPRTCKRRYWASSLRCDIGHEIGLRILVAAIARECAKYDKGFIPVISISMRHYFRVFGTIRKTKGAASSAADATGYIWLCKKCGSRGFIKDTCMKICPSCGAQAAYAGPLWAGNISGREFLEKMIALATDEKERRFLETLHLESEKNALPYDLHELAKASGKSAPRTASVIEKLKHEGFFASPSSYSGHHIRTDAGAEKIIGCI